jgi:hypothetical protein
VAVVWPVAVAVTPVGAEAGGTQGPDTGVTETQVEGAEAQASFPDGKAVTW